VEEFTREPFVHDGETLEEALAVGTARRRAYDTALAELEEGAEGPSLEWRRQYSLLLGLERLLFEDEPHLADGTLLSAHQVDALAGTLTALSADVMRNGNGNGAGSERPFALTANTDSSFCRSPPWQPGHAGDCPSRVRNSKCWPHARHSYS